MKLKIFYEEKFYPVNDFENLKRVQYSLITLLYSQRTSDRFYTSANSIDQFWLALQYKK